MEISNMKYNEMQKIAKQVGIKANMKFDRLKTALIEYYKQENKETSNKIEEPAKEREKSIENIAEENNTPGDEETTEKKPAPKGRKKTKSKKMKNTNQDKKPKVMVVSPKAKNIHTPVQKTTKTPIIVKPLKPVTPKPTTPLVKSVKSTPNRGLPKFGTPKINTPNSLANRKSTLLTPKTKNVSNTPISTPGKSVQKRKLPEEPVADETPSKRVKKSFETSEIPNKPSPRPLSRRSTFSVEKVKKGDKKSSTSPDVQDLVSAMGAEKTNEEMKKNLMKALNKKVQLKETSTTKEKITSSTQIPRFAAFLEKKKQEQNKPVTPGNKDWTKIHKKEFDKFDSIDVYLEKKRKHREDTSMSVKKARLLVEQTKEAISRLKNHKTPAKENKVKPKMSKSALLLKSPGFTSTKESFKPTVLSTKQMNLNFSQCRKSPRNNGSTFKPTVLSTDKINLNFGVTKTPSNTGTKTPRADPRKSTGSMSQRKSFATPFKFNAKLNNTIDAGRSAKKPAFDLKASLSRPMTWKAHKGKLKTLKDTYISNSPKSVRVELREGRRNSAMNKRSEQKFDAQMAKRGIVH